MRPTRYLSCIVIALTLAPPFRALWAADITVRFIDGKRGTPLLIHSRFQLRGCKGLEGRMKGTVQDCPREWVWMAITDSEGEATFHLEDPLPALLDVWAGPIKECTKARGEHGGLFETQQILREGIVTQNEVCDPKGKLKAKYSPKPGEVVIFWRRFTQWDHFLQEL